MSDDLDVIEFDPLVALAIARAAAGGAAPRPEVKQRLMEALAPPLYPVDSRFASRATPTGSHTRCPESG